MEKEIKCPICAYRSYYKHEIKKHTKSFFVYRCDYCKILFQYPFLSEQEVKDFYTKDYYEGNASYSYEDERAKIFYYKKVWKERLNKIYDFSIDDDQIRNFLDIGCSFGGLLETAKEWDYRPYGVEISDYSRNYCRKNLKLMNVYPSIEDIKKLKTTFSVITMIELIEHLKEPQDMIKQCFDLLKKDGLLVIQTANFDSLQAILRGRKFAYFLPGHLFYFSRRTLRFLLEETGFTSIKFFQPVEFSLKAKLLKSRGNFKKKTDYFKWIKITFYHSVSYLLRTERLSATASMVVYAKK